MKAIGYTAQVWKVVAVISSIVVALSIVKDLNLAPEVSSIADKNSWANRILVKWSWGWTLLCLIPTVLISTYSLPFKQVCRHLCRLVVAHCVWFITTRTFVAVDNSVGSCSVGNSSSRRECIDSDGHWTGFDISGHIFLLSYCVYVLTEETVGLCQRSAQNWLRAMEISLQILSSVLMVVWILMIIITSLYHHTTLEKLLGESIAILSWYLSYGCLYGRHCIPRPYYYCQYKLN